MSAVILAAECATLSRAVERQERARIREDALRDDLADARFELRIMRSMYLGAFRAVCEALIENERLERLNTELYADRRRLAAGIFDWTPACEGDDE